MAATRTKPSTYESSTGYLTQRNNVTALEVKQRTTPIRIFTRRYQLTYGGYKYLEIGINIEEPVPMVEIVVGNNRGKEAVLTYEDWLFCLQQRAVLTAVFADRDWSLRDLTPIVFNRISLRILNFRGRPVLHLQSPSGCVTMIHPTVRYMFALAPCVARTVESLNTEITRVADSYKNMLQIAATVPDAASAPSVIRESKGFDRTSAVDCELLAVVFERF